MLWSKFPHEPITQYVLHREQIGAVIGSARVGWVYGRSLDQYPRLNRLDQMMIDAFGLSLHIHPVVARYSYDDGLHHQILQTKMIDLVVPIIDRYCDRVFRWTLANELIVMPDEFWVEVVKLYQVVARAYPSLELWIGDYGIRQPKRVALILERLAQLKALVPQLRGLVTIDYFDLDNPKSSAIFNCIKSEALLRLPGFTFGYIDDLFMRLKAIGLTAALETSVFSKTDTSRVRAIQTATYQTQQRICRKHGAELWLWNACDASTRHCGTYRRGLYAGVWDAKGDKRLNF